jgi:hypothetical protein
MKSFSILAATLLSLYSFGNAAYASDQVSLVAKNSNLCIDIAGGSYYDWANVQQFRCHGYPNQKFSFELVETDSYGTEWYRIVAAGSGKCLDVARNSYYDGGNIIQYGCHYGDNQKFKVEDLAPYYGDRVVKIIVKSTGKCLDIAGNSYYNNGNLQQWRCHGGDNQAFIIK